MLQVISPGGASNPISVTYEAVVTPTLSDPPSIDTAMDEEAVWVFGAPPGTPCFFLLDLDPATVLFKGVPLLDTPLPIVAVPTNAAGVGTLTVPVDPSLGGVGVYLIYSQAAFFVPPLQHSVSQVQVTFVH